MMKNPVSSCSSKYVCLLHAVMLAVDLSKYGYGYLTSSLFHRSELEVRELKDTSFGVPNRGKDSWMYYAMMEAGIVHV